MQQWANIQFTKYTSVWAVYWLPMLVVRTVNLWAVINCRKKNWFGFGLGLIIAMLWWIFEYDLLAWRTVPQSTLDYPFNIFSVIFFCFALFLITQWAERAQLKTIISVSQSIQLLARTHRICIAGRAPLYSYVEYVECTSASSIYRYASMHILWFMLN